MKCPKILKLTVFIIIAPIVMLKKMYDEIDDVWEDEMK